MDRDMPQNAAYDAETCRIDAAAPPDVHGRAAEYYEANYPMAFDDGELAVKRQGLTFEQLYAQRFRELNASRAVPGAAVSGTETAWLGGASFPGPAELSDPRRGGHEKSSRAPQPGPRDTWGQRL
jgi:hypothetical protein